MKPLAFPVENRAAGPLYSGFPVAVVLLLALAIRLLHLGYAAGSPFTFHPGPDEEYYIRFGQWVAGLASGNPAEFAFMDPAYGYILGLIFKLFGPNPVSVLFFQALLDTATTWCILLIGRELGRPAAGFYAACFYALTATAVLYTATFLKTSWVAAGLAWWMYSALVMLRTRTAWPWLLFGLYAGFCIGLRSNLALLALAGPVLLGWLEFRNGNGKLRGAVTRAALMLAGTVLIVLLLAARNQEISDKFSPLPNNGGTVLHQVYNEANPRAESWYPPFAPYSHPTDILRGYAAEAQRRSGQDMSPGEVDAYWAAEARRYVLAHPGNTLRNLGRKLFEFSAYSEVANNRSLLEERMFSPVLKYLPSPFGWLLALGIPGLFLLSRNRRGWIVILPLGVVLATFMLFFAESRFRFHAVPVLALGSGILIDSLAGWWRSGDRRRMLIAALAIAALGVTSVLAAQRVPKPVVSWDAVAWGYIKMGNVQAAESTVQGIHPEYEPTAKWEEARGFLAWNRQDHESAIRHYAKAVDINAGSHVAHYNLAQLYEMTGQPDLALAHADAAWSLAALPEYQAIRQRLQ